MNNDLQNQVSAALGLGAENPGQEPEVTQNPEQTGTTEPTSEVQTQTTEPNAQQPNNTENSTIRQMREQLSKQKSDLERSNNLLKRLAEERGVSVEQLEEDLKAKEDKAKAQSMNVTPEVAKQLRVQEERIQQLEQQAIQEDLMHRVEAFKKETGFDDQKTLQFLRDAQAQGFNPLNKGTNLITLYRAMNFDTLSKAKEAEIRQQILNEMQQQRENSNSITGGAGTTNPTQPGNDDRSPQDLMNDLLKKFN